MLTGIDVFMFYSNTIFKTSGMSPTSITGMIGVVNFITPIIGMVFLGYFGRRSLMLWGNGIMAVLLIVSGSC